MARLYNFLVVAAFAVVAFAQPTSGESVANVKPAQIIASPASDCSVYNLKLNDPERYQILGTFMLVKALVPREELAVRELHRGATEWLPPTNHMADEVLLFRYGKESFSSADFTSMIDCFGYRPASIAELEIFGIQAREFPLDSHVVALGSFKLGVGGGSLVPELRRTGAMQEIRTANYDSTWSKKTSFLIAKKEHLARASDTRAGFHIRAHRNAALLDPYRISTPFG